jgi:hypothetical protein
MPYPELQYLGNFQLTSEIEFPGVLEANYGDGYGDSAIVGSTAGTRLWSLTYSALFRQPFGAGASSFVSQSRADYVFEFYVARMAAGNEPFVVYCPRARKRFLACFVDKKLTFTLVDYRLATSGLNLRQRRVSGVTTNDDGSV